MELRTYEPRDDRAILALWNTAGVKVGYAPQDEEGLGKLLLKHPDFSPEHAFVLTEGGAICGFIAGCTGAHLPWGDVRGYISLLLLDQAHDTQAHTCQLLGALEQSFRAKGKTQAAVSYFNPVRLPWVIPGTPGHQHNNMPGIATDLPLCERMVDFGYRHVATEVAMYRSLADFVYPEAMRAKEARLNGEGYGVDWYREGMHTGVEAMVEQLKNPQWSAEIPAAAHSGMKLLVALQGNVVAGFTGPIYPEPSGRGYFAGIAVAPPYEGHGLGTLLFYKLCQAEKECGAAYMSLFTGTDNHAQKIYRGAGFTPRRCFAVMLKSLEV